MSLAHTRSLETTQDSVVSGRCWPDLWATHHFCPHRYRSPGFHVQSWYDEVKDYTYPYPHECNPRCRERCSGAMCTHYTQVMWVLNSTQSVPQTWGRGGVLGNGSA